MARRSAAARVQEARRTRGERLGFRVEGTTKRLVERAARVERRSLTDFCVTTLVNRAREIVDTEATLVLSDHDRAAFFDALVRSPKPNARLKRALKAERESIEA